ncbi:hypothetical protein L3Y34_011008 [Caenorhabditis briggsae]|uniref:Uncharacterized protein n=1 Tax=Caenorhabditis briggsae TaxID=6238 RepID=A0AAE9CTX2_CAEBR|nr:hypothetical protein L3Y34_011008 [Caenorhabditis briggsae]
MVKIFFFLLPLLQYARQNGDHHGCRCAGRRRRVGQGQMYRIARVMMGMDNNPLLSDNDQQVFARASSVLPFRLLDRDVYFLKKTDKIPNKAGNIECQQCDELKKDRTQWRWHTEKRGTNWKASYSY